MECGTLFSGFLGTRKECCLLPPMYIFLFELFLMISGIQCPETASNIELMPAFRTARV
jgi:hypothetical protein